jgi:hypothetical protein
LIDLEEHVFDDVLVAFHVVSVQHPHHPLADVREFGGELFTVSGRVLRQPLGLWPLCRNVDVGFEDDGVHPFDDVLAVPDLLLHEYLRLFGKLLRSDCKQLLLRLHELPLDNLALIWVLPNCCNFGCLLDLSCLFRVCFLFHLVLLPVDLPLCLLQLIPEL